MDAFQLLGYVGAAFNIATYSMRTMVPLRVLAIASNLIFIAYGGLAGVWPILILHAVLLPLNAYRLREMLQLVARIRKAGGDVQMDWLKPFMTKRRYRAGDVLFRKDDSANEMFFVLTGRFRLRELGMEIALGQVVGELGLLAPDRHRSQTLECVADGEVLTITYDQVRQLYFQNPEFGFFFLQLTTQRLFQNISRLEAELTTLRRGGGSIGHEGATRLGEAGAASPVEPSAPGAAPPALGLGK